MRPSESFSTGVNHSLSPTLTSGSASTNLRKLSELVASITIDDINSAERCGGGGFGDVYVLVHPVIGKLALKHVRTTGNQQQVDAQLRRSIREAETWRQLTHPNVLPFLNVLKRSGGIYLVSPFVQNGSLTDFARHHPDVDRVRLIQDAAAGILYLHQCGIVHGDIKGANILVSDDVRALLCDFGLARPQEINTSTDMQGLGTVRWQSPELLLAGTGKGFKSDVWAFAMTIFEVLSGYIPYHEYDSNTAVIIAVMVHKQRPLQEPATSPNGVSYAPLWGVAKECWNEDPNERPDMQEAHDRLILGGFRTLRLSPSLSKDEDRPNDAQVIANISTRSESPSLPVATSSSRPGRGRPPTIQEIESATDTAFNPSIFGKSLDSIMRLQQETYPESKVPIVLPFLADSIIALGGTKREGIFRVPGDTETVSETKIRIDQGHYNFQGVEDPHVPASLLKMWLRELQEPIIPMEVYNDCVKAAEQPEEIIKLVKKLPTLNRRVLLFLVSFLQIFAAESVSSVTKMTSSNLALVMTPNLIRCNSDSLAVIFTNSRFEHIFVHNLLIHLRCDEIDGDYVPAHAT